MENVFEIEGVVEEVKDFYTTKSGRNVKAFKVSGIELVDWKGLAKDLQPGQKVKIVYRSWTPNHIQIPRHYVIERIENPDDIKILLQEAQNVLARIQQKLQEI